MNHFFSVACRALTFFVAWAFVLLPATTSAALNGVDLFASGDQLLTRDTSTGLDWLDLTATLNLSAHDIQGGVDGWRSLGFVPASIAQVRTLFLDTDPGIAAINAFPNLTSPTNVKGAQLLLHLLGVTFPGPSDNDFDIVGNGIAGVGEPGIGLVNFADYGTNTTGTAGFFFVPDGIASDTFKDPQNGNYLIRATPVPEPSTAALLVIGCVVALVARRR